MKEAGEKEQCKRQRCNAIIEPDGSSETARRLSQMGTSLWNPYSNLICKRSSKSDAVITGASFISEFNKHMRL